MKTCPQGLTMTLMKPFDELEDLEDGALRPRRDDDRRRFFFVLAREARFFLTGGSKRRGSSLACTVLLSMLSSAGHLTSVS